LSPRRIPSSYASGEHKVLSFADSPAGDLKELNGTDLKNPYLSSPSAESELRVPHSSPVLA